VLVAGGSALSVAAIRASSRAPAASP
jgi:hypothetical protein